MRFWTELSDVDDFLASHFAALMRYDRIGYETIRYDTITQPKTYISNDMENS